MYIVHYIQSYTFIYKYMLKSIKDGTTTGRKKKT